MTPEEKKRLTKELFERYESILDDKDMLDVLAFMAVVVLHNTNAKNPYQLFDKVLHYWIKTLNVLTKTYVLDLGSDLPDA